MQFSLLVIHQIKQLESSECFSSQLAQPAPAMAFGRVYGMVRFLKDSMQDPANSHLGCQTQNVRVPLVRILTIKRPVHLEPRIASVSEWKLTSSDLFSQGGLFRAEELSVFEWLNFVKDPYYNVAIWSPWDLRSSKWRLRMVHFH